MFVVAIFFVIFFVVQGYIVLEEETLIILASFIWLDAAGGMIRNVIETELVSKGDTIKEKFLWFLTIKKELVQKLLAVHASRVELPTIVSSVYTYFLSRLLDSSLIYLLVVDHAWKANTSNTLIIEKSNSLPTVYLDRRVNEYLTLINQSGSSIKKIEFKSVQPLGSLSGSFNLSTLSKVV